MPRAKKRPRKIHKREVKTSRADKVRTKKLEKLAKSKVISQRGRFHPMAAPAKGMPQQAQNVFMESTVIRRFEYKKGNLKIWFQSGHVYIYYEVPSYTVELLSKAPSKGRFFYYNIRTSFSFRRVR